jgi:cytochrome c-type biogenesis protein CcmH
MCPICSGQTIAQSNSGTSTQMRDLVLKKLRQGETKEEILQYFVSRYGERIMTKPNKKGFNLMLWFLPFVFMALAAIVIYLLIRRWSTRVQAQTVPRVEEAQLNEYKERLEKELKEFDEGF